ncbi:ABC transporter ATP-binding protein [Ramlibacter sp. RBP-2]|uniref:ABC transporter ATP-binding protein n=1 Tax=Ramlibacter lithotrophicus TaxID=2606681 RepID=A0A7X6I5V8_9BURK|nr:ABC transporter ATP-binding protein [Ramlibacter lithotrophicus]NKE65590.1 ABC transporter ATP-binding protein [Ramlibacter lithotrophicus]
MRQVGYTFPGWPPVVQGVDWDVGEGEFHCLVGRSGCGKTTLLKLAAGLLHPDQGHITFQDAELRAPGPRLGFVFQSPTLLEWHRVLDNVLLPVSLQHRPTPAETERAQQLLAQLGLAAHAGHYPRQLSGGQQSRVALARALILEPALLLLDEPFAALDAITREELQDDLLHMCRERRTTVLFVTHDIAEAVYLADRVAVMDAGRIVEHIGVDLPRPRGAATRTSEGFVHRCAQVRLAMHMDMVAA